MSAVQGGGGFGALPHPAAAEVVLAGEPYADRRDPAWGGVVWPASWVRMADRPAKPFDAVYRLRFRMERAQTVRLHASGDERYELRLDGLRLGRGPKRCDLQRWAFETYDVRLEPGEHVLWAWVSSPGAAGDLAPAAQLSRAHGFLLAAEGLAPGVMNTGHAPWVVARVTGVTHRIFGSRPPRLAGGFQVIDARQVRWDLFGPGPEADGVFGAAEVSEAAQAGGWPYGELGAVRSLVSARLPAMLERPLDAQQLGSVEVRHVGPGLSPVDPAAHDGAAAAEWQALLRDGRPLEVAADRRVEVLIDLHDYLCAYPVLELEGGRGATVDVHWAESLYETGDFDCDAKGHRDVIDGKWFHGKGDRFIADGEGRRFSPLWWRCGRYVAVKVETGPTPLRLLAVRFRETRYPLEPLPLPRVSDERLARALPLMERAVLVSMHETFTDSPYYEQLQYVGDTRLESLYVLTRSDDDRLVRRAIELYAGSMTPLGLTQARYPCAKPQVIPGFCLWWVAMLHDLAMWRGRRGFLAGQMPAVRATLEAFFGRIGGDGLLGPMPGWNFVDWVEHWERGVPPGALGGPLAVTNWQLVYALRRAAELEVWCGDPAREPLYWRAAGDLTAAIERAFWDGDAGLYRDDATGERFSEHTQCLAVLSGGLDGPRCERIMRRLAQRADAARATIYFSHYKFAALAAVGDGDGLLAAMDLWRDLPGRGFVATPEQPEPTRSDCHGWGGHPLAHVVTSVLGVNPGRLGFGSVEVRPCLGPLDHAAAAVPHPRGQIDVDLQRRGGTLHARIELPDGLTGTLVMPTQTLDLTPGLNHHELPEA